MPDMTEKEISDPKTIIEPTVGRMVHYYENYLHGDNPPLSGQIAFAHNDRLINIGYLDTMGFHFGKIDVPLIQPNDDVPARGEGPYAAWMNYQIGQAAKTEALQEALARERGPIATASAEEIRDGLKNAEVVSGHQDGVSD